jgi:hypothetical protein
LLRDIKDEIAFIIALQTFLFILTGLDFIVNYDGVQNYGLSPDLDWFLPYGIALNAIWIAVAFLTVSAYRLDRPNPSKGTSMAIFFTVLGEHFFCYLDSLWFVFVYLTRGNWGWAFDDWWWHVFSWVLGYFDLWWCLGLNVLGVAIITFLWYFRYRDFHFLSHLRGS